MDADADFQRIAAVYRTESEEHLAVLEEGLLELEAHPRHDGELLNGLMRAAHTLKGNSASMGFQQLAEVLHALEDCLGRLQKGELVVTPELITRLLGSVDGLRHLLNDALAGKAEAGPEGSRLLGLLRGVLAGQLQGASETAGDAPEAAGESLQRRQATATTLRVERSKLDRLVDLSGEIAIGRGRLNEILGSLAARDALLASALWQLDQLHGELQEEVLKLRMVSLGPTFRQFRRVVRDVTRAAGKQAVLVTEGEDVEVDAAITNQLRDPITHMLRNAIDHGLEPAEQRVAAGKSAVGQIGLRAYHDGGNVVVEVSDDGRGLDRAKIRARAVQRGLLPDGVDVSDADVLQLVFAPGLSTAEHVTELSGRGVGMDVVRRDIEALRGTVRAESRPGQGTTFTLRLPLTVAIINGFVVAVGEERYVIPLDTVVECIAFPRERRGLGAGVLQLRGQALPYVHVRRAYRVGGEPEAGASVVIVRHEGHRVGLVVDALLGESQVVVKPLNAALRHLPGFGGSTILGNGRVALIVNVSTLVEQAVAGGAASALGGAEEDRSQGRTQCCAQ